MSTCEKLGQTCGKKSAANQIWGKIRAKRSDLEIWATFVCSVKVSLIISNLVFSP